MSELQTITSLLNHAPFNMNLSLVSFDTKSYSELLDILVIVCHALDESQRTEYDTKTPENELQPKLLSFIKLLNYKPYISDPANFEAIFLNENNNDANNAKDLIYRLLYWLLTQFKNLETRAYVARFLKPIEISQEFFIDPIISDLHNELNKQKQVFKDIHSKVLNLQKTGLATETVNQIRSESKQLRSEKQQLIDKIEKMRMKINNELSNENNSDVENASFNDILGATSMLRKLQEEEALLYEKGHNLHQDHRMSLKYFKKLQNQHSDLLEISRFLSAHNEDPTPSQNDMQMQMQVSENALHQVLDRLRDKIDETKQKIIKIDSEINENKQMMNEAMQIFQSQPMGQNEIGQLQNMCNSLRENVMQLEGERDKLIESIDSKLGFYKQRALGVEKKKDAALKDLEHAKREWKDVQSEIFKLEQEMDRMAINGKRPMTETETKEYMKNLQQKKTEYQQCQKNLEVFKSEINIVIRTKEILESRHENLEEYLELKKQEEEIEKSKSKLSEISQQKSEFDNNKAKDLKSLSELVMKINNAVNLKKMKIKPQIDLLKQKRTEFNEFIEKTYKPAKNVYMNIKSGYDNELNKIETIVNKTKLNLNNLQSKHETMGNQIHLLSVRLDKVHNEESFQRGENNVRLNNQFQCYRDMYENEINRLLVLSKSLRDESNNIKQQHNIDIKQKRYFMQLENLLKIKQICTRNTLNEAIKEESFMNQNEASDGQADRLVF